MFLLGRSSVLNDREGIAAGTIKRKEICSGADAVRIQGLGFDTL
jgi:hypothetical protein